MTSISDKNKKLLYKKLTGINQDGIIDAIVRAGGVDNINIFNDLNLFTHIESIEGIKF